MHGICMRYLETEVKVLLSSCCKRVNEELRNFTTYYVGNNRSGTPIEFMAFFCQELRKYGHFGLANVTYVCYCLCVSYRRERETFVSFNL